LKTAGLPKSDVMDTEDGFMCWDATTSSFRIGSMTLDTINVALSIAFLMVCFIIGDVMIAGG
jgi:hypothetical protein